MTDDLIAAQLRAERFAERAADTLARALRLLQTPSPEVTWRVKHERAIRAKIAKGRRVALGRDREINDFIGIRIAVATVKELPEALRIAGGWFEANGLIEISRNNTIASPPPGGYRAIHVDYHFENPDTYQLPSIATVELQLTTELLDVHGEMNRELYHKRAPQVQARWQLLLDDLSAVLYEADLARAEIRRRPDDPGIQ